MLPHAAIGGDVEVDRVAGEAEAEPRRDARREVAAERRRPQQHEPRPAGADGVGQDRSVRLRRVGVETRSLGDEHAIGAGGGQHGRLGAAGTDDDRLDRPAEPDRECGRFGEQLPGDGTQPLDTELGQRCCHHINHIFRKNAQHLRLSPRWIRQRPEQIEHGSRANLFSRRSRMPRCRVCGLREQKPNTNLTDRPPIPFERQVDSHPQFFQYVCRTAPRTRRAIPMLRHARARRRSNNRRRRRNIKRVRAVSARSARVHHVCRTRFAVRKHAGRVLSHDVRKSRELLCLNWPPVERLQQSHNFRCLDAS